MRTLLLDLKALILSANKQYFTYKILKKKFAISQDLRTEHQGAAVKAIVALQLNQSERQKCEAFIETTKN
jgi:hypothetical protein